MKKRPCSAFEQGRLQRSFKIRFIDEIGSSYFHNNDIIDSAFLTRTGIKQSDKSEFGRAALLYTVFLAQAQELLEQRLSEQHEGHGAGNAVKQICPKSDGKYADHISPSEFPTEEEQRAAIEQWTDKEQNHNKTENRQAQRGKFFLQKMSIVKEKSC